MMALFLKIVAQAWVAGCARSVNAASFAGSGLLLTRFEAVRIRSSYMVLGVSEDCGRVRLTGSSCSVRIAMVLRV